MNLDSIQIDGVDENYLSQLKEKVKLIEKKLKENNKPKTITISGKSHNVIKRYCTSLNYNIGEWAEKIMLKEIEDNKCVYYVKEHDSTDPMIKEVVEKWIERKSRKGTLVKSNKFMLSDKFRFVGYSRVDGLPIYDFLGDMNDIKSAFLGKIEYIKEVGDVNKFSDLDIKIAKVDELSNDIQTPDSMDAIILNSHFF